MPSQRNAKMVLIDQCCGQFKKTLEAALVATVTAKELEVVETDHDRELEALQAKMAEMKTKHDNEQACAVLTALSQQRQGHQGAMA